MGLNGFAELTLEARDMRRLERFYVKALGLEPLSREDDRVWLAAGPDARLGLWAPGPKEFGDEGGRHVHYAFSAEPGSASRSLMARVSEGCATLHSSAARVKFSVRATARKYRT